MATSVRLQTIEAGAGFRRGARVQFVVHGWELQCGAVAPGRVLDIRPSDAFGRGHLKGSTNLPYNDFQDEVLDLIVAGERVLIVDAGGARAAEMATWLRARGLAAGYLEGGLAAWTGPLERV